MSVQGYIDILTVPEAPSVQACGSLKVPMRDAREKSSHLLKFCSFPSGELRAQFGSERFAGFSSNVIR